MSLLKLTGLIVPSLSFPETLPVTTRDSEKSNLPNLLNLWMFFITENRLFDPEDKQNSKKSMGSLILA